MHGLDATDRAGGFGGRPGVRCARDSRGNGAVGVVKPHYTTLSNRTTFTRWAYTNLDLKVRKSPSLRSRSVGRLHFNTEDGPPEIYLALQR